VTTWLLAITRNLAIDVMRVRRPLAIAPDELVAMPLRTNDAEPSTLAVANDDAARLHEAVARLPEEQRRAILLAGIAGFSAREVAEAEGIPLGTAKTRIRAAMLRLRAVLVTPDPAE
jgi:RNA polymerase sigma-70 factor (ECF subfamily)